MPYARKKRTVAMELWECLRQNPGVTAVELAEGTGIPQRLIERYLRYWRELEAVMVGAARRIKPTGPAPQTWEAIQREQPRFGRKAPKQKTTMKSREA